MNLDRLTQELEIDEGVSYKIYIDSEGHPTFGVGHLITEDDPEWGMPVGTYVDEDRISLLFFEDIENAISDAEQLFPDLYTYPETIQHVLANMSFNLGYTRLSKFIDLRQAVYEQDWEWMSEEMEDSHWYNQVGSRSERLVEEVLSV